MSKVTMPERPDPDGFLAIRLAGHEVEVNAYRDSTLDAYAELYAAARVREALEEAALIVDLATQHHHVECWGNLESLAGRIRALIPSTT